MNQKILIAYYSWAGNTKKIAEQIQSETGGTLFEIIPETAYPEDYNETVQQAKKEIADGFKPTLKTKIDGVDSYDIVFIGSPNWWSTNAPPVDTFLSENDLSGKTVVPFCTHGGGGQARTAADVSKMCPNSTVLEGFCVSQNGVEKAKTDVSKWLNKIGVI